MDDFGTVWSTARDGQRGKAHRAKGKARTARGKKLQDHEKKMSSQVAQVVQVAASRRKYCNCRGLRELTLIPGLTRRPPRPPRNAERIFLAIKGTDGKWERALTQRRKAAKARRAEL